jgi:multiple inositol-polyphosphate phosphatase/2,3-bisphosphoglycerate 3-phosphatase
MKKGNQAVNITVTIIMTLCCSKLENGETQPAGVFYFSHDTDMQLFFTSLGVAKDMEALTHSNYTSMENRQWRTSFLTPFAANFAAVFFK